MVLGTSRTLLPPGSGSSAMGLAAPVIHRQQTFMILCLCTRSASMNPSISQWCLLSVIPVLSDAWTAADAAHSFRVSRRRNFCHILFRSMPYFGINCGVIIMLAIAISFNLTLKKTIRKTQAPLLTVSMREQDFSTKICWCILFSDIQLQINRIAHQISSSMLKHCFMFKDILSTLSEIL